MTYKRFLQLTHVEICIDCIPATLFPCVFIRIFPLSSSNHSPKFRQSMQKKVSQTICTRVAFTPFLSFRLYSFLLFFSLRLTLAPSHAACVLFPSLQVELQYFQKKKKKRKRYEGKNIVTRHERGIFPRENGLFDHQITERFISFHSTHAVYSNS